MFVAEGAFSKITTVKSQYSMDAIILQLSSTGYTPVLRSMIAGGGKAASLSLDELSIEAFEPKSSGWLGFAYNFNPPVGDILIYGERAFLLQPSMAGLQAWEIRHHSTTSEFSSFLSAVGVAIKSLEETPTTIDLKPDWRLATTKKKPSFPSLLRKQEHTEATLSTKSPDYSEIELQAAKSLVSSEIRSFALRFAQVGKVRGIDVIADVGEAITQPLLEVGILKKEYLVLCRKDSHTICTVENSEDLDSTQGGKFLCSICGRAFSEEIIQEIFAITGEGKRLLNKSQWMTIWITDLLINAGIRREYISWNATASEDELDIMVETPDTRIFFELKDRGFGLGDAYPFATRVTRYKGDVGVVVTTEAIADEAKKFFAEQRSSMEARIDLIEGSQSVDNNIQTLIDSISRNSIRQIIYEFGLLIGFNLVPILAKWMDSRRWGISVSPSTSVDIPAHSEPENSLNPHQQ